MGETVSKVLTYVPPPISAYRDDVPDGLDELVARSLAKKREDRFSSAAEFADALRALNPQKEDDIIQELGQCFAKDFAAMPDATHVDSLEARDSSWREAQDVLPPSSRLPLSSWPPGTGELAVLEHTQRDRTARTVKPNLAVPTLPVQELAEPARRSMPKAMVAAVGAALILALGALVVSLLRAPATEKPPRFLVVETPHSAPTQEPAPTQAEALNPPTDSAPAPTPSPPAVSAHPPEPKLTRPNASPSDGKPDPRKLSRTFAAHQGKVQGCFRQHAANVTGQPQVSIRFKVSTGGQVQSADVIPAGLATTPLGQCILNVARGVQFGPQSEAIVFAIPITARRVESP